jgi:hypothetical protein
MLAYYALPRWYEFGERRWNDILTGETEELREKPVPVPLCPPQISHGLTQARTRASAVRGRWLTTWAMAWPKCHLHLYNTVVIRTGPVCLRFKPCGFHLWESKSSASVQPDSVPITTACAAVANTTAVCRHVESHRTEAQVSDYLHIAGLVQVI